MTTTAPESTGTGLTGTWEIDPTHSRIGFAAKHAMITTVRGRFTGYTGDVYLDEQTPANSGIHLEIDAASIDTGNTDRDAHLRSPDFFDLANHPTIVFDSTKVQQVRDDVFELTGDLTINGKANPVTVTFERTGTATDPWGGFRAGFEGSATVNRRDWGLAWNVALDKGGVLVGEKVKLEFEISAVKRG